MKDADHESIQLAVQQMLKKMNQRHLAKKRSSIAKHSGVCFDIWSLGLVSISILSSLDNGSVSVGAILTAIN